MAMLALLRENKKNPVTKCNPSKYWTWDLSYLDLVLFSLVYQGTCYLGDLRNLYGRALLVLNELKWCRNMERQFQNIQSSTGLDSSERWALEMNGSNTHFSNILWLNFLFSHSKASDAIIANFVCLWKLHWLNFLLHFFVDSLHNICEIYLERCRKENNFMAHFLRLCISHFFHPYPFWPRALKLLHIVTDVCAFTSVYPVSQFIIHGRTCLPFN